MEQEQQAATAEAAAGQLQALLALLTEVTQTPLSKAAHQAEALKSSCAALEALRRLLTQDAVSGLAVKKLLQAVQSALNSTTAPPSGKVTLPCCSFLALKKLF